MSDKIIRAVAKNGMVRIIAGITTDLVEDARVIHECTPVAAASLGRMLTAGALLGATLKSSNDRLADLIFSIIVLRDFSLYIIDMQCFINGLLDGFMYLSEKIYLFSSNNI